MWTNKACPTKQLKVVPLQSWLIYDLDNVRLKTISFDLWLFPSYIFFTLANDW